jgi:hypothetical protein
MAPIPTAGNTMPNSATNTTRKATSQGDGMPNIDSLISNANRLEQSYNSWNHAYLVFVVITAIVAGLLVLTTGLLQWTANRKHDEFDSAQKAVIAAKDEQLKEDLAHRDLLIARVKADADVHIAQVEANAKTESKRIENEARERIEAANKRSEEISAKANADAAQLTEKNLATESRLEEEHKTRVELEKTLLPRVFVHRPSNRLLFERLKQFAGTKVSFETINDAESQRAASGIVGVLREAGWDITSTSINPELNTGHFDGVRIECSTPEGKDAPAFWTVPSYNATVSVVDLLKEQGWTAVYSDWTAKGVEVGSVRIRVGFKPSLYFLEKLVK